MLRVLRFLAFPSTVVAITVFWLWLDKPMGWHGPHYPWAGWTLIVLGCLLAWACAYLFFREGQGSPNPFTEKTKKMVDRGPYGVVRNPMMYGVGAVLAGLALLFGSAALWIGIGMFVVFVATFVPLYEEPDMERRFGEEFRDYCRRVPRWWPRFGGPTSRL